MASAHPILQTVRIPLADFPGLALGQEERTRHPADIRPDKPGRDLRSQHPALKLARQSGSDARGERANGRVAAVPVQQAPAIRLHAGAITAVRNQASLAQRDGVAGVEIEIASSNEFPGSRQPAYAADWFALVCRQPLRRRRPPSRGLLPDGGRSTPEPVRLRQCVAVLRQETKGRSLAMRSAERSQIRPTIFHSSHPRRKAGWDFYCEQCEQCCRIRSRWQTPDESVRSSARALRPRIAAHLDKMSSCQVSYRTQCER